MTALLSKISILWISTACKIQQASYGSNTHHSPFPIRHLCAFTLITRKLLVVYGRCTYRMTALLSEMSIFCVRAGCVIRMASYGSKHSLLFFSNKPFVGPYRHNLKTTGYIWTFSTSNDLSTIGNIPCVVQSWKRYSTGELWFQTCIGCSLIQKCAYTASLYIHRYLVRNYTTPKLTYLMPAYYTPNNSFTANDASFYKTKVGQLHYTLQCFSINRVR